MSNNFNIDLHCHPSTKPFMSALQVKKDAIQSFNHKIENEFIKILKGLLKRQSEVLLESQSNFDHLFEGGHKVVIASITPMEKAFLVANQKRAPTINNIFIFDTKAPWENTIKPPLINALMGFSISNIEFLRGSESFKNYFEQGLKPEYEYLIKHHQKKSDLHGYLIKFVKDFTEIEQGLASGEKAIYVLISIEGAHSFKSVAPNLGELKSSQGMVHSEAELDNMSGSGDVQANIRTMKREWEFTPLYVTLMHHFWNGMGGHARSLNKNVGEMLNQQEGINQRLTGPGKLAIRTLLEKKFDINDNGTFRTITVPRILIDIKHMGVASRRGYYEILDNDFAAENIPVICSHTGMADTIDTLDELALVNDKDEESNENNYFHKAQINLCGEDVRRIVKSKGLIGIQLDEKRVAGAGFIKSKLRGGLNTNDLMHECAKIIMANIFVAVKAVNDVSAWNVFCIGSDYDGLINYLDPFPTSAEVSILRDEIEFFLGNLVAIKEPESYKFEMGTDEMKELMMGLSPKEITQKIFSDNIMQFLSVNFKK